MKIPDSEVKLLRAYSRVANTSACVRLMCAQQFSNSGSRHKVVYFIYLKQLLETYHKHHTAQGLVTWKFGNGI